VWGIVAATHETARGSHALSRDGLIVIKSSLTLRCIVIIIRETAHRDVVHGTIGLRLGLRLTSPGDVLMGRLPGILADWVGCTGRPSCAEAAAANVCNNSYSA
jgi:hypothetical protein